MAVSHKIEGRWETEQDSSSHGCLSPVVLGITGHSAKTWIRLWSSLSYVAYVENKAVTVLKWSWPKCALVWQIKEGCFGKCFGFCLKRQPGGWMRFPTVEINYMQMTRNHDMQVERDWSPNYRKCSWTFPVGKYQKKKKNIQKHPIGKKSALNVHEAQRTPNALLQQHQDRPFLLPSVSV